MVSQKVKRFGNPMSSVQPAHEGCMYWFNPLLVVRYYLFGNRARWIHLGAPPTARVGIWAFCDTLRRW